MMNIRCFSLFIFTEELGQTCGQSLNKHVFFLPDSAGSAETETALQFLQGHLVKFEESTDYLILSEFPGCTGKWPNFRWWVFFFNTIFFSFCSCLSNCKVDWRFYSFPHKKIIELQSAIWNHPNLLNTERAQSNDDISRGETSIRSLLFPPTSYQATRSSPSKMSSPKMISRRRHWSAMTLINSL